MSKITSYVFKMLFWRWLLCTILLVAVIWLTQSLRLLDLVINQGAPLGLFLQLIFLVVPEFLTVILPLTGLFSVVSTFLGLRTSQELTILRASGLGLNLLVRPVMLLVAFLTMLSVLLVGWVAPMAKSATKDLEYVIRSTYGQVFLDENSFNQLEDGTMLFIQERIGASEIKGLILYLPTATDTFAPLNPSAFESPPEVETAEISEISPPFIQPIIQPSEGEEKPSFDTAMPILNPAAILPLAVGTPEARPETEKAIQATDPPPPTAVTILAERGLFKNEEGVLTLSLYNGLRENFDPLTNSVSRLEFGQYTLSVPTGEGGGSDRATPQANEFSIPNLWERVTSNKNQLTKAMGSKEPFPETEVEKTLQSTTSVIKTLEKEQRKLLKDIHARFTSLGLPLSIVLMGFLIVLQADNPRGIGWQRFVAAVVFGIGLQGVWIALSYQIVANPRLIWLLYALSVAPGLLSVLWIFAPEWLRKTTRDILSHLRLRFLVNIAQFK